MIAVSALMFNLTAKIRIFFPNTKLNISFFSRFFAFLYLNDYCCAFRHVSLTL